MPGQDELGDGGAADYVFLQNPFEDGGRNFVVPSAVGVDHGDGAAYANAKAVAAGAVNGYGRLMEAEFLKAAFEVGPGGVAGGGVDAVGAAAKQDMAADFGDAVGGHLLGGGGS